MKMQDTSAVVEHFDSSDSRVLQAFFR